MDSKEERQTESPNLWVSKHHSSFPRSIIEGKPELHEVISNSKLGCCTEMVSDYTIKGEGYKKMFSGLTSNGGFP